MNTEEDKQFDFWQKWLYYSSLLIAAGVLFIFILFPGLLYIPYVRFLAESLQLPYDAQEAAMNFMLFFRGPFGATLICAYLMLAWISSHAFKRKDAWARNAIAGAFSVWFIIDSLFCMYYGIWFQLYAINLLSFLQKALPLGFTWKYFKSSEFLDDKFKYYHGVK
ncbi:MAG TPA: hypothetical protein VK179_19050 [Bacteroidales bacterium]|nr:hypothetical protein [Bacteroidales bacterium]